MSVEQPKNDFREALKKFGENSKASAQRSVPAQRPVHVQNPEPIQIPVPDPANNQNSALFIQSKFKISISNKRSQNFINNLHLIEKAFNQFSKDTNFHLKGIRNQSTLQSKTKKALIKFENKITEPLNSVIWFLLDYNNYLQESDVPKYNKYKNAYRILLNTIHLKLIDLSKLGFLTSEEFDNFTSSLNKKISKIPKEDKFDVKSLTQRKDNSYNTFLLGEIFLSIQAKLNQCNAIFSAVDRDMIKASVGVSDKLTLKPHNGKTYWTYQTPDKKISIDLYEENLLPKLKSNVSYSSISKQMEELKILKKVVEKQTKDHFVIKKSTKITYQSFRNYYDLISKDLEDLINLSENYCNQVNKFLKLNSKFIYGATGDNNMSSKEIAAFIREFELKYNSAKLQYNNAKKALKQGSFDDSKRLEAILHSKHSAEELFNFLNSQKRINKIPSTALNSQETQQNIKIAYKIKEQADDIQVFIDHLERLIHNVTTINNSIKNTKEYQKALPKTTKEKVINAFKMICRIVQLVATTITLIFG